MDRTRHLVNEYARANGYEITMDFVRKKRMFSKGEIKIVEDGIVGSSGFAGFCDGYQGRPHRYKGPAGTPEKSTPDFLLAVGDDMSLPLSEDLERELDSVVKSVMIPTDYDEQYKLGSSCSK